jgi:hypothetical protein
LKQHIEQYKKINPEADDEMNVLHDMKLLIQKKLKMFPEVKKVIVNAFIEPVNDSQYQLKIISTDKPEQLHLLNSHNRQN